MDRTLFAEMIGAVLVEVHANAAEKVSELENAVALGEVITGNTIKLERNERTFELSMQELTSAWEKPFSEVAR